MRYDDDELAEAALLLAHHQFEEARRPAPAMPAALDRIPRSPDAHADGAASPRLRAISTTHAGALAIEVDGHANDDTSTPDVGRRGRDARRASSRSWGWLAAAACFAFAVYEWRSSMVEREARTRAAASQAPVQEAHNLAPAPHVQARQGDGKLVADVRFVRSPSSSSRVVELTIESIPANAAGEQYRVWLSPAEGARAIDEASAVGAFVCADACERRVFAITIPEDDGKLDRQGDERASRSVWITRNRTGDPWRLDAGLVVAEGHRGAAPTPGADAP